jgi:hypothetical protein
MLPPGVADCLEIYYPKVDTHLVLQPVVFGVGLSPETMTRFPYLLYYGPGDERAAQEIYERFQPELVEKYGTAGPRPDTPEMPRRPARNDANFGVDGEVEKALRKEMRGREKEARRGADRAFAREDRGRRRDFRRDADEAMEQEARVRLHGGRRSPDPLDLDLNIEIPEIKVNIPPIPPIPPVPPVPPMPPMPDIPPMPGASRYAQPVEAPRNAEEDLKEERMFILKNIAEGKISVDDAVRLLEAMNPRR